MWVLVRFISNYIFTISSTFTICTHTRLEILIVKDMRWQTYKSKRRKLATKKTDEVLKIGNCMSNLF